MTFYSIKKDRIGENDGLWFRRHPYKILQHSHVPMIYEVLIRDFLRTDMRDGGYSFVCVFTECHFVGISFLLPSH